MATTGGGSGYPAMPTLRGAVPGWPKGAPLTTAADPEAARTLLHAREATSVVDPVGLRRWWIGDVVRSVIVVVLVWELANRLGFGVGRPGPAWVFLFPLFWIVIIASPWLDQLRTRAVPLPAVVPWRPVARVRWHRRVRREPVDPGVPVTWPPGSESLAVLVAAAGATSLAPSWLGERLGMPREITALWVAALLREGWLSGGGHVLGWSRLPELHVELTDEGRERLDHEVERLWALATS